MGAYSTINITRDAAIHHLEKLLSEASDGQHDEILADIMDVVLRKSLYNCFIVNNDDSEAADSVLDYL